MMYRFCLWFLGLFRKRQKRVASYLDPKLDSPPTYPKYVADVKEELDRITQEKMHEQRKNQ